MSDPSRFQPVKPVPEALDDEDRRWAVRAVGLSADTGEYEGPHISNPNAEMYVPFGQKPGNDLTRAHEMAHVAWSPKTPPEGPDVPYYQAVEDARVGLQLRDAGVNTSDTGLGPKAVRTVIDRAYQVHRALPVALAVSTLGTGAAAAAIEGLKKRDRAIVGEVERTLGDAPIPWKRVEAAVKVLRRRLGDPPPEHDVRLISIAERVSGTANEGTDFGYVLGDLLGGGYWRPPFDPDRPWGEMIIEHPPRPVRLPARKVPGPTRRGAADEGALLVRPHRLPVDGRVFDRRRRLPRPRGSVLIDASGSMSFSALDIQRLVEAYPLGVVAVYTGNGHEGLLSVVAHRGARADEHEFQRVRSWGGQNVIDVPALGWLGGQREPRIWVSDGGVTGVHDCSSPVIVNRCDELCRSGRVVRYESLADLEGGRPAAVHRLGTWEDA